MRRTVKDPLINTLRLDRPGIRAVLGDLEAEIMEVIWSWPSREGVTVRQVHEVLYPRRGLAYTTVMNTMARLARKGFLSVHHAEPAYVYRAAMSREELVGRLVGRALERLLVNFGGVPAEALRRIDPRVRARLERLFDRAFRRSRP